MSKKFKSVRENPSVRILFPSTVPFTTPLLHTIAGARCEQSEEGEHKEDAYEQAAAGSERVATRDEAEAVCRKYCKIGAGDGIPGENQQPKLVSKTKKTEQTYEHIQKVYFMVFEVPFSEYPQNSASIPPCFVPQTTSICNS